MNEIEKVILLGAVGFGVWLLWTAYSFNAPTGAPLSAFQPLS